ncbi:MAG: hypothetical protein Q9169_002794 [Polycauliona sp. 2 TL-2023]
MASTEVLNISLLVITFNCARELLQPDLFASRLSKTLPDSQRPVVVLLSLQEIAPIAYSFLGGSYLSPYFQRFRHAIDLVGKALGGGEYVHFITRNVGMTACMVFVLEEHREKLQWLETGGVGVGLQQMGNKAAVGVRLRYAIPHSDDAVELSFLAAHLAPMEEALQRRNEDWKNIVRGLVFTPASVKETSKPPKPQASSEENEPLLHEDQASTSQDHHGLYAPTSYLILAGDLNYRTSSTKPFKGAHAIFPQLNTGRQDNGNFYSLLHNDQLSRERKGNRTCHGLSEAPIHFPPTYKYSKKAQMLAEKEEEMTTWDWAKHRWPSWCDRVLYLDLPAWMTSEMPGVRIEVDQYTSLPLMPTSDHQPVIMTMKIPLRAIPAPEENGGEEDVRINAPFDIDPRWRERRQAARRKEIVVGILAYLSLTWEGRSIILALIIGALLGWAVVQGMLM